MTAGTRLSPQQPKGSQAVPMLRVNSVSGTPLRPVWVTRVLRVLMISHCCGVEYNWMIGFTDSVLIFISGSISQWHTTPPPRCSAIRIVTSIPLLRIAHQHGRHLTRGSQRIVQTVSRTDYWSTECWKNYHPRENNR